MPTNPDDRAPPDPHIASSAEPALDEQAAAWWLRRQEGLDAAAQAAFNAWLAASPLHAEALEHARQTWQALDDLPQDQVETMRAIARMSTPYVQPARKDGMHREARRPALASSSGRRAWMRQATVAGLAFAALGGGAWILASRLDHPVFNQTYATGRGQQREVQLPDGSTLAIDAATRLQVVLYRDRREVQLDAGQAMFSVAGDSTRPFHVSAGNTRVTVVGTRFTVRHVGTDVNVAVDEGRVRVEQLARPGQPDGAGRSILLAAGEAVKADASGTPARVTHSAAIAAWRSGRINFDNTPLADALAEFARYGEVRLTVRDPAVAAMRVTGSFDIAGFASFIEALPEVLPVRLVAIDSGTEVVRR